MYLDVRMFEAAGWHFSKSSSSIQRQWFFGHFDLCRIFVATKFSDKQALTTKLTACFTEENCSSALVCVIGIVAVRYSLFFSINLFSIMQIAQFTHTQQTGPANN